MQSVSFSKRNYGSFSLGPTGLGTVTRKLRDILDVFGEHVKHAQISPPVFAPRENNVARIRRPRRIFAVHKRRRDAALARHDAQLELAPLARERDPFSVRRPVRLGRVNRTVDRDALRAAAARGDFEKRSSLIDFRRVANPFAVG